VLESLVGFRVVGGDTLIIKPCVPDQWPHFTISYRVPGKETRVRDPGHQPIGQAQKVVAVVIDGRPYAVEGGACHIPLLNDGALHRVELVLGRTEGAVLASDPR
jgi:cyclic beta-1,2-glucan synthetase